MNSLKTYIITGGNSGLGYQCAKNIAIHGNNNYVIIASRNSEKSIEAVRKLILETQNSHIEYMMLDLASLQSIRDFANRFSAQVFPPLCGIVCNAISGGKSLTKDGFNMTFGTGHLGHFLLMNLLLKNMQDGRIIFVSSDQHNPPSLIAKLHYYDAHDFAFSNKYNHNIMYSYTKLCNIYCAYELSSKLLAETDKRITVNAFNPGFMADTGLAKPKNAFENLIMQIAPILARLFGTRSSAIISGKLLAEYMLNSQYEGITGKYFDRDKEIKSSELSYNKENADKLWKQSIELTKLQQDETIFPC